MRAKPLLRETELLNLFLQAVPYALPHVRVFRRNILNVEAKGGWWARSGIAGQADAYALVRGGRHIEIETKAARGELRSAQEAWRRYCEEWGIPHLVLRADSGELPNTTVQRWVDALRAAAR